MGFWIFMLTMDLLIPVTMIGFGAYFRKRAPGEINGVFGYRTARSMASRAAWDYAHRLCGRIWLWVGLALLPVTAAAFLPLLGGTEAEVGQWGAVICFAQMLLMIAAVIPVEVALSRRFDRNGEPKPPADK